jgi:O-antigen ligase
MVKFSNLHNYLIVFLLFTMTINASFSYLLTILVALLWIAGGDYRQKLYRMFHDRLALSFLAIFLLYLAGMLWTEDMHHGLKLLSKEKLYLFAPFVISFFDKRYAKYALGAFLAAVFISEIYSLYLYFTGISKTAASWPSPFIHHMHYSLILAFTFGYLISEIDFKNIKNRKMLFYLFFALLTLIVLFVNKGRIGQAAIIPVLFILAIWKFRLSVAKSVAVVAVGGLVLFFTAYHFSDQFKTRMDKASYEFHEVVNTGKRDSIACRFEMWDYALKLGKSNPVAGVGTGDGVYEMNLLLGEEGYRKLYYECGLGLKYVFNPHNNFLFFFMLFGLLGAVVITGVLAYQFWIAYSVHSVGMMLLLTVTVTGMLTASPISVHVKYIFFYTMVLTMLYMDALYREEEQKE